MFVGETGVTRVIQRTCEAMKEAGIEDPNDKAAIRKLGVIDLPTIQKKAQPAFFPHPRSVRQWKFPLTPPMPSTPDSKAASAKKNCRTIINWRTPTYPVLRLVDGTNSECGRAGTVCAQHAPARRLPRRHEQRHGPLEQGDRKNRH